MDNGYIYTKRLLQSGVAFFNIVCVKTGLNVAAEYSFGNIPSVITWEAMLPNASEHMAEYPFPPQATKSP